MKHAPRRHRTKPASGPSLLARITPNAAGIDCGSAEHYVAVPADRDAAPVRAFKTFTTELHRLADWLTACGVTTVAMESTGVYWIPLYEILEARGLDVVLVNARHVKNVPGRKTDVLDCQWLQELHSVGLLRGSFRPTAAIAALRAYLRHRETLVQSAATHVQRMQKALVQMNLQLSTVISDITGVTGLRIVRDIVAGQTDPRALAQHRDARCQTSEADIMAALTGHYRPSTSSCSTRTSSSSTRISVNWPRATRRSRPTSLRWPPRRPPPQGRCQARGRGESHATMSPVSTFAARFTS